MSNNTNSQSTTFWKFLTKNTIEIPIIQRDYAQGRLGKENLRKNFLADLKNALDSGGTMKLDFVYGSIENDNLNPLDGQQRLTTLWLLHWYIALRAGELSEDNCQIFSRFTYETRISSREFCHNLCVPEYFKNFEDNDIVGFITKQTWFYSAWKQDPTIQSMLRMLGGTKIADKGGEDIKDGIEESFQETNEDGFKSYWEKLTQKEVIVFYHLPLKVGLSDDLYIKMNARGKQLTSFENFKADLIGYITKQAEDNPESEWKDLLDAKNGIPIKLDTDWTDIFWKNKSKGLTDNESKTRKSNQIDEIYFAFFNRFFWNELFIAKNSDNKYILDIGKGDESSTQENNNPSYKYLNNSAHDNDATIAYEGLEVYRYDNGTIPLLFFQKIKRVLDNYFAYSKCNNCLPECPWETSFRFIPIYEVKDGNNTEITNNTNDKILSVSTLNQVQRIVFFAVCKYFDHDDEVSDSVTSLKRWMRVVWNLVSGEDQNGRPEIRSTSALRTAIKFIDSLESHKVYESLNKYDVKKLGDSSFDERCKEEIEKAKQILNGKLRPTEEAREEIITEVETYSFFHGSIRFLFTDEKGDVNDQSWQAFDTKWSNAKEYFNKDGQMVENYQKEAVLLRYYISKFKKWWEFWNFVYDNNPSTWKQILLSKRYTANHNILMCLLKKDFDFLSFESNLVEYGEGYKELQEKVQKELVKTKILVESSQWSMKLNWRDDHNTYCLYPYNTKAEWKIYVIANKRNQILSQLYNEKVIETTNKIKNCDFFWGWNINFKYNSYDFQWNTDGNVYLIENNDRKKDENGLDYLFSWDGINDANKFKDELDSLIKKVRQNGNLQSTHEQ